MDTYGYIWIHMDANGYIWIHMDTYEYIIWMHMGAQEPGPGPKLAAGPNGPGSHGPWPWARVPGTLPPVLGQGLALGPPYVSILCIHMCPYIPICILMYPYVSICIQMYPFVSICIRINQPINQPSGKSINRQINQPTVCTRVCTLRNS